MYQNYIFDLYGTLIDIRTNENKPFLWKKMSEIYSSYGAFCSAAELRELYRWTCLQLSVELPENGEININQVFEQMFLRKGVICSEELVRHIAITFRTLSRQKLEVYPGVRKALRELKSRGKGVYLLSNAQTDFTRPEIEMMGLTEYFDGIFISSEVGYKKPSKEFFDKLLEAYQLDPKTCLMVGNDESADIQGARLAGMDSLYIHTEISPAEDTESTATYSVMDGDWKKVASILLK